jgi:uncharacterized protein
MNESATTPENAVIDRLAAEFRRDPSVVAAALRQLDTGAPIPFLARYRRDWVGGLGEEELRALAEAAAEARAVEARRAQILEAIAGRADVPERLRRRIERCRDRTEMENLYLPFRPPRRTRATIAREHGLEPLAEAILREGGGDPNEAAAAFVDPEKGIATPEAAVAEALAILAERFSVDVEARAAALRAAEKEGVLKTLPPPDREAIPDRHSNLRGYEERLSRIPPHRFLAVRRAEKEGAVAVRLEFPEERVLETIAARHFPKACSESARAALLAAAHEAVRRILAPASAAEALARAQERAERETIAVVAANLHDMLLYPPAGPRRVLGVDPARRGAIYVACIDELGHPVGHARIRPFAKEEAARQEARETVAKLCRAHRVEVIALGNGPGRHDCEAFLHEALEPLGPDGPPVVTVNEVGVGAYATGPAGRAELPGLPVPARAAVSLARRLVDPLAELVKIDVRHLGVGQYVEEVDAGRLVRALRAVVEHCVNAVGVDVNRAPAQQLAHVCGFDGLAARAVVEQRERAGPFRTRAAVRAVPHVTPVAFERAGGFLRVHGGEDPLDATGVHPDDAPLVGRIAESLGKRPAELIGNADLLQGVVAEQFADARWSASAVAGVLFELIQAGRDPRPPLEIRRRRATVRSAEELRPGMQLEGRVTNVTPFGAFVDVGVRQDGLVHVSELSDRFVKDPTTVVRVGQVVNVRVLAYDAESKRISLSMKSGRPAGDREGARGRGERPGEGRDGERRPPRPPRREPRRPREDSESKSERAPEPAAAAAPPPAAEPPAAPSDNPIPEGMTEEEYMKRKLEELRRRFR